MLHRMEFARRDGTIVGSITDVSVNLETVKNCALTLLPAMRSKDAMSFLIRDAGGVVVYRSQSAPEGTLKLMFKPLGSLRTFTPLRVLLRR